MKRSATLVAILILLSFLIRLLGGFLPTWSARTIIPIASLLLPWLLYARVTRDESDGASPPTLLPGGRILPLLPLLPVFVLAVVLLANLSALLAQWMGLDRTVPLAGSLPYVLFTSALIPALTEELLCRYLCLRPLVRFGKAPAVLISSLLFAAMHLNMAQIPYAFCAGLFLASLAISSGTVWLPILFHLVNNAVSVLAWYFGEAAEPYVLAVLIPLSILGLAFYLLFWKRGDRAARALPSCLFPHSKEQWRIVKEELVSPLLFPILTFLLLSLI